MALSPGMRVGPYEILSAIGAGGMGDVYRARDRKLGREVAIKILAPQFTSDRDRLARFQREARLLATLNHRGVAASARQVGPAGSRCTDVAWAPDGRFTYFMSGDNAFPMARHSS